MREIKEKLKNISKYLKIKYNDKWFKYNWISKEENVKLEYMWMCPDPIFAKYGRSPQERAKNVEKFLLSDGFKKCLHQFGGQVINKDTFKKYFLDWINNIKNIQIKEDYLKIYKKILNKLNKSSTIAILTKTNKKQEKNELKNNVLLHEWIHILINKNNLRFSYNIKDEWKYNEGLVTFLQELAKGKIDKLEENAKRASYDFQKQYYIYAIRFKELLKKVDNPKERKEKIINLKNSLLK